MARGTLRSNAAHHLPPRATSPRESQAPLAAVIEAINAHRSRGSEANKIVERFDRLSTKQQQDIINFLRSL